jgi:hypothetical protein
MMACGGSPKGNGNGKWWLFCYLRSKAKIKRVWMQMDIQSKAKKIVVKD